jgi:hypothetical protein
MLAGKCVGWITETRMVRGHVNSEVLSQACLSLCSPNTRSRFRSSTPSRLEWTACSKANTHDRFESYRRHHVFYAKDSP